MYLLFILVCIFSAVKVKWNINKISRPFWFDLLKVNVSLYSQSRASNWVSIPKIGKNSWLPTCTKMPFWEIQSSLFSKIYYVYHLKPRVKVICDPCDIILTILKEDYILQCYIPRIGTLGILLLKKQIFYFYRSEDLI